MRHSCCVNACRVRGSRSALSLALRFRSSAQLAPNLTVPSLVLPLRSGFETEPVSMVQSKRASAGLGKVNNNSNLKLRSGFDSHHPKGRSWRVA